MPRRLSLAAGDPGQSIRYKGAVTGASAQETFRAQALEYIESRFA